MYLLMNPDVAKAGADARKHFLRHGQYEGRKLRSRVTCNTQHSNNVLDPGEASHTRKSENRPSNLSLDVGAQSPPVAAL
jgi:hypothetical protein